MVEIKPTAWVGFISIADFHSLGSNQGLPILNDLVLKSQATNLT